jgi:5,5'-dehydrodivanillate O-demethylase oxygenase subunit
VQCQENSSDRKHTRWLHGFYSEHALKRRGVGEDDPQYQSTMRFVDFPTDEFILDPFEYGYVRRNTIKGGDKTEGSWTIGTPLIFPNMNITSSGARFTMIWRTPVDDTTTLSWFLHGVYPGEGIEIPAQNAIETVEIPMYDKNGKMNNHLTAVQDHIAFFAQGEIVDRSKERLGHTDRDVIVWRKSLTEELAVLEAGGEPINVFRDPAAATFIKVPLICKDDPNRFGAYSLTAERKYQKRSSTVNYSVPDLPIVDAMEEAAQRGAEAWLARNRG